MGTVLIYIGFFMVLCGSAGYFIHSLYNWKFYKLNHEKVKKSYDAQNAKLLFTLDEWFEVQKAYISYQGRIGVLTGGISIVILVLGWIFFHPLNYIILLIIVFLTILSLVLPWRKSKNRYGVNVAGLHLFTQTEKKVYEEHLLKIKGEKD